VANLAWRSQPPDESADEQVEAAEEDAEVVDLTKQRLLGWVRGMFGGRKQPPDDQR
jgi:hypothetical protein